MKIKTDKLLPVFIWVLIGFCCSSQSFASCEKSLDQIEQWPRQIVNLAGETRTVNNLVEYQIEEALILLREVIFQLLSGSRKADSLEEVRFPRSTDQEIERVLSQPMLPKVQLNLQKTNHDAKWDPLVVRVVKEILTDTLHARSGFAGSRRVVEGIFFREVDGVGVQAVRATIRYKLTGDRHDKDGA